MDGALSTMEAADAGPAHLSWTGPAAKSESPQFSSGFILAHQLWKIGHQMNSDFNPPGVVFEHQTEETGARPPSSHHHHFRRITDNSVPDSRILKSASYNGYSKLTAFFFLNYWMFPLISLLSFNHLTITREQLLHARSCIISLSCGG